MRQKNKISWLSTVSMLSMVALLLFQIYWLYGGYQSTYNKFVDDAREALQEACKQQQETEMDFLKEASITKFSILRDSSRTFGTLSYRDSLPSIDSTSRTSRISIYSQFSTKTNTSEMSKRQLNQIDSLFRETLAAKGLSIKYSLELRLLGGEKYSTGERSDKGEVKIELAASNMQTDISVNSLEPVIAINILKEPIIAYLQFTPLIIFQKMAGILLVSVLLFLVILYCLISQLKVIRRQKTAATMKNDFIANFTHELKTPIAVVYAALDAIERKPEAYENATEAGKLQLKRLSDSVEKILTLSLEEHGVLELRCEEFELNTWLQSLIEPFRLKSDKETFFDCSFSPEIIFLKADKTHLANVVNNIIDNALKYSAEQVCVKIKCERNSQSVRISISDNGFGIATDDLKKIFDRFYRAKSVTDYVKGFGLGLNYAKTVIELHNGTIIAESSVGEGSTFIIEIPQTF